jgi:hypothetical protein
MNVLFFPVHAPVHAAPVNFKVAVAQRQQLTMHGHVISLHLCHDLEAYICAVTQKLSSSVNHVVPGCVFVLQCAQTAANSSIAAANNLMT